MNISVTTILAALFMPFFYKLYNKLARPTFSRSIEQFKHLTMPEAEHFIFKKSEKTLPLFFLSHGGPTFADKNDKIGSDLGAWNATRKIGNYIKYVVKPDFIIIVSAHWQTNQPDEIEVSVAGQGEAWYTQNTVSKKIRQDENALIYDFYGFSQKYYDSQFHTISNNFIANDIVKTLKESDWFQAKVQQRGIDHGAFVPMKVAFGNPDVQDSGKLDIDVPVIQVSLAGTSDIEIHYKLGEVLSKYRDLNCAMIFSGMSVHNLRDLGLAMANSNKPLEYVKPFNEILTKILTNPNKNEILQQLKQLPNNPEWASYYRRSHPTNEHLLPAVVAAGASRGDECKLVYENVSGSLGWNLYRWGSTNEDNL